VRRFNYAIRDARANSAESAERVVHRYRYLSFFGFFRPHFRGLGESVVVGKIYAARAPIRLAEPATIGCAHPKKPGFTEEQFGPAR
jgi:hypothetical protein